MVKISLSIPNKILAKIDGMSGKNRNEKILKCIQTGYDILKIEKVN